MTLIPKSGDDAAARRHDERFEPLDVAALRWRCDPGLLEFDSTDEIEPLHGVVGQETALEALRFGLDSRERGQHVFVSGLSGTGRMTLVRRLLDDIRPTCPLADDRCYVHNFDEPTRPILLTLPRGQSAAFAGAVSALAKFIRDGLSRALGTDAVRARLEAVQLAAEGKIEEVTKPLHEPLAAAGLALVSVKTETVSRPTVFPLHDGAPVAPESYELLRSRGEVSAEQYDQVLGSIQRFASELEEASTIIDDIVLDHEEAVARILAEEARHILEPMTTRIGRQFVGEPVAEFLTSLVTDVVDNRLASLDDIDVSLFGVNVISSHAGDGGCPVVVENSPTVSNLLGGIDRKVGPEGAASPDHLCLRGGALLRADGGFLLVEARDLLEDETVWRGLMRALRSGEVDIGVAESTAFGQPIPLKPDPIPIDVKVVLLGDPEILHILETADAYFPELFKVLAEFDDVIPRERASVNHYASVIARIVREEELRAFDRAAVAELCEHGARIAARRGKLTARFARIADIVREASFVAGQSGAVTVSRDVVRETVRRTKRRAGLASRRFRELLADGIVRVQTTGLVTGQINGLAVMTSGALTYGFPARITATIGAGSAGVINIEREAALSGAIHTKGFFILGGLLRHLLATDHPLVFDASIAFEQSYGGIDGDSASCAEICCLISALTEVPIRQDLAITGAIDQLGSVLPVGGVNEKIEGFYDTCCDAGLTGRQGVIIPKVNTGDLMLRHDVVEACGDGRFHIYAVDRAVDALALLTGEEVGTPTDQGFAPPDSLLAKAVARARRFWEEVSTRPESTGQRSRVARDNSAGAGVAEEGRPGAAF